ncbi:MAG: DUF2061 domain-containing protein [Rickettsiales bacterium]
MRTLAKTITYGMMHVTVAVTIAYLITGNFMMALGIGLIEPGVQTICFFMHETAWERSNFLRPAAPSIRTRSIYS